MRLINSKYAISIFEVEGLRNPPCKFRLMPRSFIRHSAHFLSLSFARSGRYRKVCAPTWHSCKLTFRPIWHVTRVLFDIIVFDKSVHFLPEFINCAGLGLLLVTTVRLQSSGRVNEVKVDLLRCPKYWKQ